MFQEKDIIRQVRTNCDISDSHHAGLYSICGLALRLRDLYKWEKRLPPWEEKEPAEVLEWIGHKEEAWEGLAESDYAHIAIDGNTYDPFDTGGINAVLEFHGFFYGAGYAYSLKPSFFLAEIDIKKEIDGYPVYFLGKEMARDLLTLPALTQDNAVLFRQEAAGLFLWDKMFYIKKSGRRALNHALAQCGLPHGDVNALRPHLGMILDRVRTNYIRHELGEHYDTVFDPGIWREMLSDYPHTPVELLARTIKDLLADTGPHGTLGHILMEKDTAALAFFVAFFEGLAKAFFPELVTAFEIFMETGDWNIIANAVSTGHQSAETIALKMTRIYREGKNGRGRDWARTEIEEKLLDEVLKKENSGTDKNEQ